MPQLSKRQKDELLARLRAFPSSGLKVKLYGNVCSYYQSFVGRDFKAWAKMAIFVMGPYLNEGQLKVLQRYIRLNPYKINEMSIFTGIPYLLLRVLHTFCER